MKRVAFVVAVLALAVLAAGCYERKRETFVIEPIQIDNVQVLTDGRPRVAVDGIIGDGCSEFDGLVQEREGNQLLISLTRKRRTSGECRLLAKLYNETIELRGDFPPGDYLLTVNSQPYPFTIR